MIQGRCLYIMMRTKAIIVEMNKKRPPYGVVFSNLVQSPCTLTCLTDFELSFHLIIAIGSNVRR